MKTRAHIHEEAFSASPEEMFALLHKPSAIRGWWGASRAIVLPRPGGFWCAAWGESEDEPDYITSATIEVFAPPRRLVLHDYQYYARSGAPSFDADFSVEFLISPQLNGVSLRVTQDGFPANDDGDSFFEGCVVGWTNTFTGIRKYLDK